MATVNPGGSIVYTLTVKNNGDDPAYSVDVQEDFPLFPALNPGSFTASQGVYTPATGHWDLASLPVGNSATLTFTVTAPNFAGSLVNNATTSSAKSRPHRQDGGSEPRQQHGERHRHGALAGHRHRHQDGRPAASPRGARVTYTIVLSNSSAFDQQDNPGNELTGRPAVASSPWSRASRHLRHGDRHRRDQHRDLGRRRPGRTAR